MGVAAIHQTVVWHKLKQPKGPPHRQPFNLPGLARVNLPLCPVHIIPMDSISFNYHSIIFGSIIEMGSETVKKNSDQYLLRSRQKQKQIFFDIIYYCCWKTIRSFLILKLFIFTEKHQNTQSTFLSQKNGLF